MCSVPNYVPDSEDTAMNTEDKNPLSWNLHAAGVVGGVPLKQDK